MRQEELMAAVNKKKKRKSKCYKGDVVLSLAGRNL